MADEQGFDLDYAPAPESTGIVELADEYGLYIGGEFVEARSGRTFDTISPSTEERLATVSEAGAEDVDRAVGAARTAFEDHWRDTPGTVRARYLYRIARQLQERSREFAVLETMDGGKPIRESRDVDLPLVAAHFFHHAGWADKLEYAFPNRRVEPHGVAGQVIPWNFPMLMAAWKLAPALACGNTVVLKPAETTPLTALLLAEVLDDVGLPPGVVNVVTSADHLVGEALAASPQIDMVAFTGSTTTGRRILEVAAPNLTRVFLELGGKSVNLVLEDADLETTLAGAAVCCMHGGQGCAIPTRLMVPRNRYDEAVEMVRTAFQNWAYGDPTDLSVLQGPQISRRQQERVLGYIEQGRAEGATVVCGGDRPAHLDRGWYVEPTLFADVDNAMVIAQEEIFGPDAPFGGYKGSGLGRQCGREGLEIFTETKTVGWPAGS